MSKHSNYVTIGVTSIPSGLWHYAPVELLSGTPESGIGDQIMAVREARLYHFGILSSMMHMSWIRFVSGRLESSYRFSSTAAFKNFPWPIHYTQSQLQLIEMRAQDVLDARAANAHMTLTEMYHPLTMPSDLLQAHAALDEAVDNAYGVPSFETLDMRVRFLLNLHLQITAFLISHHDTDVPQEFDAIGMTAPASALLDAVARTAVK